MQNEAVAEIKKRKEDEAWVNELKKIGRGEMTETVAEIKKRKEDEAWNNELKRLGRYDLIKDRVGTLEEAPSHYNVGIEPVKYIQSHGLDFLQGSVIKYVTRYKLKGQAKEDLMKARLYIDMMLKDYEV
tara:strand:- start:661 stop:1047 length:387 start_codon:yes stop_codon:yes gene_type:complete